MSNKLRTVLFVLLMLIGFGVLMFPTFSNVWNEHLIRQSMMKYEEDTNDISENEYASFLEEAAAYNAVHKNDSLPDAFAIGEQLVDETYEVLLNLNGDGIMGYVEIPSISVSLPIYHGTTTEVLKKGVGHLSGSSLPVGGESTHTVLSAHRGLPSSKLFTDLDLLKEGDLFYLHVLGQTLVYEVDQITVAEPKDVRELRITPGKDFATLLTCTPYGVNTQRLMVRGHRVTYSEEEYQTERAEKKAAISKHYVLAPILGLLVVGVGVLLMLLKRKNMKKKASGMDLNKEKTEGHDQ